MREVQLNSLTGFEELPDIYYISDTGDLISYGRGKRKVRKPMVNSKGYLGFFITGVAIKVHRAVAIAFIPNPESKPQVNHIDGDKTNNKVSNLEWCTNLENMRHSWDIGLREAKKREDNYQWGGDHSNCKAVVQLNLDGKILDTYKSIAIASRETGFKRAGISKACNKVIKTYMGFRWKFVE